MRTRSKEMLANEGGPQAVPELAIELRQVWVEIFKELRRDICIVFNV
jgi:hypothetical protein